MNFGAYLINRKKAFIVAFKGLIHFFKTEYSAWIHAAAIVFALILGWYFEVSRMEWIAIFLLFGIVLTTEILNTAIELLCDFVHPEHDEKIGTIKDIAAGGVFFSAVIAVILALLIFFPKFKQLL